MKKIIVGSFIIAAAFVLTSKTAHGQEIVPPKPQDSRGDMRAEVQGDREKIQEMRRDNHAFATSSRADIQNMRKDIRQATSTPVNTRMELKNEIEARKAELAARRASTTAMVKATAAERVQDTLKLAQNHLSQELQRLMDIKTKIESRLSKFDEEKADTTESRNDLAVAVTALQKAESDITAVGSVEITSDLKASAEAIRGAVNTAQTSVDAAQKSLAQVVDDMKALVPANTTATSSTQSQ